MSPFLEWRKNKLLVCVTDLSCIFAAHLQFKFVQNSYSSSNLPIFKLYIFLKQGFMISQEQWQRAWRDLRQKWNIAHDGSLCTRIRCTLYTSRQTHAIITLGISYVNYICYVGSGHVCFQQRVEQTCIAKGPFKTLQNLHGHQTRVNGKSLMFSGKTYFMLND